MFYELLNKETRQFLNRAKSGKFQGNRVIGKKSDYYVEYFQERLYWLYDDITEQITMIYASSPSEAVEEYERWI